MLLFTVGMVEEKNGSFLVAFRTVKPRVVGPLVWNSMVASVPS